MRSLKINFGDGPYDMFGTLLPSEDERDIARNVATSDSAAFPILYSYIYWPTRVFIVIRLPHCCRRRV